MKEQKLARMSKLEKQRRKNNGEDDPKERDKASAKRGDGIGKDGFFELEASEDEGHTDDDPGKKSRRPSTKEELALLAADIDDDGAGKRHFDMAKVIKAEKMSAKKKQPKLKTKGQPVEEAGNEDEAEDGRGFEIDVKDKRFQALHDEHEFAIDPSNPHFKKTKAMSQLLDERRKRLKEKVKAEAEERGEKRATSKASAGGNGDLDLQKLVQSVKRKSGAKDAPHSELRKDKKKKFKSS
ncbi:pre-rRNA-processing protein esf1 [Tulasnella sp. 408]|nr:pre-rRNA-processing protein esf1 [Tulasnella sp. 408]